MLLVGREEGFLVDNNMYTAALLTILLTELLSSSALRWHHRSRQIVEELTDVYLSA
eukprot:CAMPEP_0196588928 /NCGR_PEP_ID=MMETSP1081-20130531/62108_1 /TAXON_ID=36882 /ORGANISM="Pyramimonas amylifera, Strain CCMP720" /LENGTH=55 /DNA_ID=CAMNT_0041911573 /DNA_START=91 /DNA_END=254 /DNA_ORIENTATION=+